jgi:hypothetical protein
MTASGPSTWRVRRTSSPLDRLPLEVLERPERDEQEVAAPACRVEDAHRPEPLEEGPEDRGRVVLGPRRPRHLAAREEELRYPRLHRDVFAPYRPDHHRFHQPPDVVAARVVGAELGALAGVEAALEERAEDRGSMSAQLRWPTSSRVAISDPSGRALGGVEQPPSNQGPRPEHPAAVGHSGEQLASAR